MTWRAISNEPLYRELPFKFETNRCRARARGAHFVRGTRGFRMCEENGAMRFHDNHARLESSHRAARCEARVELPLA